MGFGTGFGSFMQGLQGGYTFMSRAQENKELADERRQKRDAEKAASASIVKMTEAQQGTKERVAGELPMANGVQTEGPPKPKVETVVDLDKVDEHRLEAMQNIAKAYGPMKAMELNALFRQQDEMVTRKMSGDLLTALQANRLDEVPSIYNRTRIGGIMENVSGDPKTGFMVKFKGNDTPQQFSMEQITKMLAAKNTTFDTLLDEAYRERTLALQERTRGDTTKHQVDTLAETSRHNQAMEGIYKENYGARNQNTADANVIRQQGLSVRADDKLYPDSMFKVTDALGGESLDLTGKAAAKRLHGAFAARGYDDDQSRALTMGAIAKAREKSGGDPVKYQAELNTLLDASVGKAPPPAVGTKPAAAPAAPPAQGINPESQPAPAPSKGVAPPQRSSDPLAGLNGEAARKVRAKLVSERKRYEGRPEAAARVKEIDVLLDRIDRRDY